MNSQESQPAGSQTGPTGGERQGRCKKWHVLKLFMWLNVSHVEHPHHTCTCLTYDLLWSTGECLSMVLMGVSSQYLLTVSIIKWIRREICTNKPVQDLILDRTESSVYACSLGGCSHMYWKLMLLYGRKYLMFL